MADAWRAMRLSGWGRSHWADSLVARPERLRDARAALHPPAERSLIARGLGRSYGDAALNDGGATLLTTRLDRLLAFDPDSGALAAEAGVSFRSLLEVFLPRGFLVPVTPGTAFATLGGAVANDVHGKNHERVGSFGDRLDWIDLLLASGEVVRASAERHPELFRATVGGLGLTGVILAVGLRLMPVPSNAVRVRKRRLRDLDALFAALAESAEATYSVAWIDALARGADLGRGILETAEPVPHHAVRAPARRLRVPFDFPSFALAPAAVRTFNALYYRRVPAAGSETLVPYERFLYPLDSLLEWNRLYGRRGFHQFQCVLPPAEGPRGIRRLLETTSAAQAGSFLAVLKRLGGAGRGFLSFPMPGYTLALDVPRRAGVEALFGRLEAITLEHGGRVYLAKDSLLSPAGFAAMYPELPHFRTVLATVDPARRFDSALARRLHIREPAS